MTQSRDYRPRYDQERDISRHAAVEDECCYEMQRKYGWELIAIEEIDSGGFKVDCVFQGKAEFPRSFYETEREEEDA